MLNHFNYLNNKCTYIKFHIKTLKIDFKCFNVKFYVSAFVG